MTSQDPRSVEPSSRSEWRAWLAAHSGEDHGVWLVLRKGTSVPLSYDEAVEEAIAAGWVDSKANRLDEQRYKLWIAPRRSGSGWSRLNKERVQRLVASGAMTAAGLAAVAAAKADGSWESLDKGLALEIPPDLASALEVLKTTGFSGK